MKYRAFKYFTAFLLPLLCIISFFSDGYITFLPVIFAFFILPVAEFVVGKDTSNLDNLRKEIIREDKWYNYIIYLTVPVQVLCLLIFLFEIKSGSATGVSLAGKISSMGLMCGVFGINVAHELGHRNTLHEKLMSKLLLSTSLYMHFYIEHNRGHHRNVGTPEDPATARRGENIYFFWVRTVVLSFFSSWKIVKKERERKKLRTWSLGNEFIQYLIIEILICVVIYFFCGYVGLFSFLAASAIGILLLESVNYIEHYGLYRNRVTAFRYEDVQPVHSWNSDFILGRLFLFELTRHSDHHWDPAKHYESLDSIENSSNLPAGYPAMILCAMVPPVWFNVMNKRLDGFPKPSQNSNC